MKGLHDLVFYVWFSKAEELSSYYPKLHEESFGAILIVSFKRYVLNQFS